MEHCGVLLFAPAFAHSPHDVVPLVSVAEDGTVATIEDRAIALSADGWSVRWIGFPFDTPRCVFALGGDAVAAVVPGEGVYVSQSAGDSWSFVQGPVGGERCVRSGSDYAIVGREGLAVSSDGSAWTTRGPSLPLRDVALADGEIWALDDEGALLRLVGEAWVPVSEATGPYVAVAAGGGAVLLAPAQGPLARLTNLSPVPLEGSPEGVVALSAGPPWLAATADEGVWVSEDEGERWRLEDEGLEAPAEGVGAPLDGVHFNELVAQDERWWLASWEGLFYFDERWTQVPLRTIPLVNTLAWLDDELLVGTNGGGLYRGTPFGEDWRDVSRGIGWPWMRQLAVSPGVSWLVGAGDVLYRSDDEGAHWEVPPVRLPTGGDVTALSPDYARDGRAIFGGLDGDGRATIAFTEDFGASWEHAVLPGDCTEKPGVGAMSASMARVSCGTELFESADLRSWVSLGELPAAPVAIAYDGERDTWVATRGGLLRVPGGDGPEEHSFDGRFLTALALLPSGEPLVAIRGDGLSTLDGPLRGWPVNEPVEVLAVSPTGQIAVGSHLGLSVSTDGGETFALACPYDRYDDHDGAWRWEGWAEAENARAKAGDVHVGVAGSEAWWTVEAETLRLIGLGEGAVVSVDLDGTPSTLTVDRGHPGVIFARTLEPGRHVLHLRVEEGTLALDGGERWRWGGPPEPAVTTEDPRCGCGHGSSSLLLLGLLPALRRSRVRG